MIQSAIRKQQFTSGASRKAWLTAGAAVLLGFNGLRFDPPGRISGFLLLLGCHLPVALGALAMARRLIGGQGRGWTHKAVLALQIYFTALIGSGMLLGVLGILNRPALLAVSALAGFTLLGCGARRTLGRIPKIPDRMSIFLNCTLAVVILMVGWKCITDAEYVYDVLNYHLVFPAEWVQDGRISIVSTWFGDPAPAYAPSATQVYFTWLLAPMMSDEFARCGQFPYWLLLLAAVDVLAAALRLPKNGRRGLVVFVALMPGLAHQAATAMVDVALAAHLVCLAAFSLRTWREGKKADAVGLALSIGGLLGTKFIALTYLTILLPLVVLAALGLRRCRRRWDPKRAVWLAAAAATWIGLYWYARNTWVTGNPVYPLDVGMGSVTLFGGAFGKEQMENSFMNARRLGLFRALADVLWQAFAAVQSDDFPKYPKYAPALGLGALLIGNFAGFVSALADIKRRLSKCIFYVCAVGCIGAFWLVFPVQDFRYAWGPVVLLVTGAARAGRGLGAPRWVMGAAAVVVVVLTYLPLWDHWLMRGGGEEPDERHRAFTSTRWRAMSEGWSYIDRYIHGARIGYSGNNVPYFLYGRRLENRVQYIPARQSVGGLFYDFAKLPETQELGPPNTAEPMPDRYRMEPEAWISNLKTMGIEYFVVSSLRAFPSLTINVRHDKDCFPIERTWLDHLQSSHPSCIEKKSLGPDFVLYHLKWTEGCLGAEGLSPVIQTETDALSDAANYPCADSVIEARSLRPLTHRK